MLPKIPIYPEAEATQMSLTGEWIYKLWYIHKMEYYLAITINYYFIQEHGITSNTLYYIKETKVKMLYNVWFIFYNSERVTTIEMTNRSKVRGWEYGEGLIIKEQEALMWWLSCTLTRMTHFMKFSHYQCQNYFVLFL